VLAAARRFAGLAGIFLLLARSSSNLDDLAESLRSCGRQVGSSPADLSVPEIPFSDPIQNCFLWHHTRVVITMQERALNTGSLCRAWTLKHMHG